MRGCCLETILHSNNRHNYLDCFVAQNIFFSLNNVLPTLLATWDESDGVWMQSWRERERERERGGGGGGGVGEFGGKGIRTSKFGNLRRGWVSFSELEGSIHRWLQGWKDWWLNCVEQVGGSMLVRNGTDTWSDSCLVISSQRQTNLDMYILLTADYSRMKIAAFSINQIILLPLFFSYIHTLTMEMV